MDIKEIIENIKNLNDDIEELKTLGKDIFQMYLTNQYDRATKDKYMKDILGSVIKLSGYNLAKIANHLEYAYTTNKKEPTKTPDKILKEAAEANIVKAEPKEEIKEVPDNIGNTTEEPVKELTYSNKREIFKKRLRKLRTRNNTSIQELATMLNIRYSVVHAWESKGVIPRQNTLEELAKLFNVPSQYLIGEGE